MVPTAEINARQFPQLANVIRLTEGLRSEIKDSLYATVISKRHFVTIYRYDEKRSRKLGLPIPEKHAFYA